MEREREAIPTTTTDLVKKYHDYINHMYITISCSWSLCLLADPSPTTYTYFLTLLLHLSIPRIKEMALLLPPFHVKSRIAFNIHPDSPTYVFDLAVPPAPADALAVSASNNIIKVYDRTTLVLVGLYMSMGEKMSVRDA